MPGKRPKRKKGKGEPPAERAYGRLTRHDRNGIERGLDRGLSCREIAGGLGRAPSTVKREVDRHRYVTAPRSMAGEPAPDGLGRACARLGSWPRCCNGCRRRAGYGCNIRPHVFYSARAAQAAADADLVESRRGIDETEAGFALKLSVIKDGLGRGLSPEQIAAANPHLGLSASTIYRWVGEGYAGMTNMDLRRKVGYKPRSHGAAAGPTDHSPRRSHDAFLALGEDACASAWEMDTVLGRRGDSTRLLTLLHRPSRLQLALPVADGTCAAVLAGLGTLRQVLGEDGMRLVFRLVLTDNGAEFSDEAALASALGEGPGETRLFYCDPRRADQKGACEKNHVEIRKVLPKGRGISLDRLSRADCALLMSHVNSEPRGCLGFRCPYDAFIDVFGDAGRVLLDALGVERVDPSGLDLTPRLIGRARRERGDAPLA